MHGQWWCTLKKNHVGIAASCASLRLFEVAKGCNFPCLYRLPFLLTLATSFLYTIAYIFCLSVVLTFQRFPWWSVPHVERSTLYRWSKKCPIWASIQAKSTLLCRRWLRFPFLFCAWRFFIRCKRLGIWAGLYVCGAAAESQIRCIFLERDKNTIIWPRSPSS
jgi:hypothetical protein